MSNISLFSADQSAVIAFEDKKGKSHSFTTEGALFKGGQALRELKTEAGKSAINKAASGRYRSAAEILSIAFPKAHKAFVSFIGSEPWDSKMKMALFLDKVEAAEAGKNGWTAKQLDARALVQHLRNIPALSREVCDNALTINA